MKNENTMLQRVSQIHLLLALAVVVQHTQNLRIADLDQLQSGQSAHNQHQTNGYLSLLRLSPYRAYPPIANISFKHPAERN